MLSIRRIMYYIFFPLRRYALLSLLIFIAYTIGEIFMGIVQPILLQKIIDHVSIENFSRYMSSDVMHLVMMIVLILIGTQVLYRIGDYVMSYIQAQTIKELQRTIFDTLLHHSYQFFSENFTGSLVAKFKRFSGALAHVQDILLYNIWFTFVNLVGIFIVLFHQHTLLGMIFFVWSLVYIGISLLFVRKKKKFDLERSESDSRVTGILSDVITNILNVKIFSGHAKEKNTFDDITEDQYRKQLRSWYFGSFQNTVQGFLMAGLQGVVVYVGVQALMVGELTLGVFVLLQTYIFVIFNNLWGLGRSISYLVSGLSEMQEMIDVLDTPVSVIDPEFPEVSRITAGFIEFRNVSFTYHKTEDSAVFDGFNLTIPAGQKVGFVGHSGSGKTTITKLLLRFMDIQSGSILIDGQNINNLRQEDLRNAIAYVPQDSSLFHRTIRENITYVRPDVSDAELIQSTQQSHAYDFIMHLPQQFDSLVGERGVKLSGGERQRIAIARAMLKKSPILVLDEATSALDSISETYIQDSFTNLMKGKTTLVIAHRLSTVQKMDRIIVLDQGKIVEDGTHKELLEKKGYYYNLWSHQAGGFIE